MFPGSGHALLLDPGVNLLAVMRDSGFLIDRRHFTSAVKRGTVIEFGAAGPIELPSPQEVQRAGRFLTAPLRQLCSPVFLSTLPDGTVQEGLGAIGDPTNRPLLCVAFETVCLGSASSRLRLK